MRRAPCCTSVQRGKCLIRAPGGVALARTPTRCSGSTAQEDRPFENRRRGAAKLRRLVQNHFTSLRASLARATTLCRGASTECSLYQATLAIGLYLLLEGAVPIVLIIPKGASLRTDVCGFVSLIEPAPPPPRKQYFCLLYGPGYAHCAPTLSLRVAVLLRYDQRHDLASLGR